GEIVALVGPNGAGKTTLLNILTGMVTPDEGECFVGGQRTTGWSTERISRLGVARTFQELRLAHQVSVMDNLLLAAIRDDSLFRALYHRNTERLEQPKRIEALQLLNLMNLNSHWNRNTQHLSYGQKKIVGVLAAYLSGAKLLLLDEPVSGLSPKIASEVLQLMKDIGGAGRGILFIEHNLDAVRRVADRLVLIDESTIKADGPPNDVLTQSNMSW
ncbi:MAG: ABC transporter ATP-binding protein, partial [Pseudomonadales bacterium]|nr:ABC transporter ATP-binding protein [Pseudomonadales bacterium]